MFTTQREMIEVDCMNPTDLIVAIQEMIQRIPEEYLAGAIVETVDEGLIISFNRLMTEGEIASMHVEESRRQEAVKLYQKQELERLQYVVDGTLSSDWAAYQPGEEIIGRDLAILEDGERHIRFANAGSILPLSATILYIRKAKYERV